MKPVSGKAQRFRDQMLAAAKSDFEPDIAESALEEVGESWPARDIRYRAPDAAAGFRSGRPGAKRSLWPLAAAEERAAARARPRRRRATRRDRRWRGSRRHHRSVWYSRCSSRARGSIEEMYICS